MISYKYINIIVISFLLLFIEFTVCTNNTINNKQLVYALNSVNNIFSFTYNNMNNPCIFYNSCTECVFDASNGILTPIINCAWCVTTRQCLYFNISHYNNSFKILNKINKCQDLRHIKYNSTCPDMLCSAAKTTNNIYICRPITIFLILCTCILAIVNMCFYFWMLTIRQLPWKYEPRLSQLLSGENNVVDIEMEGRNNAELEISINDNYQHRYRQEEDEHRYRQEEDEHRYRQEEDEHRYRQEEDEHRYRQEEDEHRYRQEEDEHQYRQEEDEHRYRQEEDEHRYRQEEDEHRYRQEEDEHRYRQEEDEHRYRQEEDEHRYRQEEDEQFLLRKCSICKMIQPVSLYPGFVCFWCNIARFGFLPFYIGICSTLLNFILFFSVSLKPWFSDRYFIYLLLSGFTSYIIFIIYIYFGRLLNPHIHKTHCTFYIELAVRLRGRSLLSVIPLLKAGKNIISSSSHNPHNEQQHNQHGGGSFFLNSNTLLQEEIEEKKRETTKLLNMEYLNPKFRKILNQILSPDEYILWYEKPEISHIVYFNLWLIIDFIVGIIFGLWICIISTIKDSNYFFTQHINKTYMRIIGLIFIILSSCLLITILSSTIRIYILTNRRLLTIFNGIINPTIAETELKNLYYVYVYNYKIYFKKPLLTFSWELPVMERNLPTLKTHSFPAIINLKEFLYYFKSVIPLSLLSMQNQTRQSIRHWRQVWRMHIFLCIMAFQLLPIIIFYSMFLPVVFLFLLFIIISTILLTTLYRGICAQHTIYASLSVAKNWVKVVELKGDNNIKNMTHVCTSDNIISSEMEVKDKSGISSYVSFGKQTGDDIDDEVSREMVSRE